MPVSPVSSPLPPLFGKARRPLGWQGYSTEIPHDWNPGKFSGTRARGDLRVDDDLGVRFELRWEHAAKTPNVEKSVSIFLQTLQKDAKKRKAAFQIVSGTHVVSRSKKRKEQVVSFGWTGDAQAEASCGFGAAWYCPTCERVTFAHIVGQANEKITKIERLASEVIGPLECHGEGGWDNWSLLDLKIEIPTEFELSRAQILLNKIELEWTRPRPAGMRGIAKRAQRLKLWRFPAATALLADLSLEEWTQWNLLEKDKQTRWQRSDTGAENSSLPRTSRGKIPQKMKAQSEIQDKKQYKVQGHEALSYSGRAKDPRQSFTHWFFDFILRRRSPKPQLRVWDCPVSNRIWALETETSIVNSHLTSEVLDSVQCH